jgi:ribosomal-protein-alanine N-acetyltransferase
MQGEKDVRDVRVRPMTEYDLSQVMDIEFTSFPMPWSPLAFVVELRSNPYALYLVLERTEPNCSQIFAYIGLWQHEERAWIARIAVARSDTRKGWGTRLLNEAEEYVRLQGLQTVMLEVRQSNAKALSFCHVNGYRQTEILRDYYDAPREDAVVLAKNLTDSYKTEKEGLGGLP